MPFEKYQPVRAARAARPHMARQEAHAGAPVVLGRPARRQPGPHRPDGPRAQAAHVRCRRAMGFKEIEVGFPSRQPARLRLRPRAHRGGPHPRRRHDPGAHPVPPRADRAHLRVRTGRAAGDRALLQLDLDPAAARRVRPRQGRHHRHRGQRRQALPQARGDDARHRDPLRVLARELHRHRDRLRGRDLRGGDGRHRADPRPASWS